MMQLTETLDNIERNRLIDFLYKQNYVGDREEAKDEYDRQLGMVEQMPNRVFLYRIAYLPNDGDLRSNDNICHNWVYNKKHMDNNYMNRVKQSESHLQNSKPYYIKAKVPRSSINMVDTVYNRFKNPNTFDYSINSVDECEVMEMEPYELESLYENFYHLSSYDSVLL